MDPFDTPSLVAQETGTVVLEQQAYLQLIRAAEVMGAAVSDLVGTYGLSGKQYNLLRAVRRGGKTGLTASEIGRQMTDPRADVTRLVDRLERDGLVERHHDRTDRRVVHVHLTAKGGELLARIDAPILALHRAQLVHMTQDEIAQLIRLLKKARKAQA